MKIYTRTGDKGETSFFGGKRVLKSSLRVESYGTVDELNSLIGIVISKTKKSNRKTINELKSIQHDLFTIGALLANPTSKAPKRLQGRVDGFERLIDDLTKGLPKLRNFILPGGGQVGAFLHFARTICRRAERAIVKLANEESVDSSILIYFNRLSDLLFTMARFINQQEKQKETIWSSYAKAKEDKIKK